MSAKCPRWTTPNGTCSDDDSGAGQHACNVLAPGHAKCRCACGVETLRPAGDREVARYEERIGRASITVDEKGTGRVVVGLTDISNHVSGGVVEFNAGHPTVLKVAMACVSLAARGDIELDEETAKALEALGWSGPDTELLRRRDLQEALGGLGTVLREWDALLEWVRLLVTHNGELAKEISSLSEGDEVLAKVTEALGGYAPSEAKWSTVIEAVTELSGRMEGLDK